VGNRLQSGQITEEIVKIPINALKEFASKFGLNRVIVFASEPDNKTHHVATYGRTITECSEAADFGNKLKEGLGWPETLRAQPSRVVELQKKLADLKAENDGLKKLSMRLSQSNETFRTKIDKLKAENEQLKQWIIGAMKEAEKIKDLRGGK
jgi:predicted RNase H-like nuclease (RuvC/YqgF family)